MPTTNTTPQDAVADYCNSEIDLNGPCSCVQATGWKETMLANQYCGICDGTGKVTVDALVSKVDKLSEDIDELSSTAGDICTPAKKFLQLAWWHAENAYRKLTGHCSLQGSADLAGHHDRYYACCSLYDRLRNQAERLERSL